MMSMFGENKFRGQEKAANGLRFCCVEPCDSVTTLLVPVYSVIIL